MVVWDTGGGPGLAASGSPRARSPLRPLVLAGGGGGKEAARAGAESEAVGFHHANLLVCLRKLCFLTPKLQTNPVGAVQPLDPPRPARRGAGRAVTRGVGGDC